MQERQVNTKGEGAKEGETRSHDQLNAKEGAGTDALRSNGNG